MMTSKFVVGIFLFLISSCNSQNTDSKESSSRKNDLDSCSIAKPFENAGIIQLAAPSGYTGVLNNYWGTDTTKLDFQHYFEHGELIKSIFYYENGKAKEEYFYKCGALNGLQKLYHENGKLARVIPYSYGHMQGVAESYYENGILREQAVFVSDSLIGDLKSFNENGELIKEKN